MANPDVEYEALRAEMLELQSRAHEVWKWGVISILGVVGTIVTVFAKDISQERYPESLGQYHLFTAFILCLFASSITVILNQISISSRNGINKIGAYLSVFHEKYSNIPPSSQQYGYHTWNRIEKFTERPVKITEMENTNLFKNFHGSWILNVLLLSFCLIILIVVVGKIYTHLVVPSIVISMLFLVFIGYWLIRSQDLMQKEATWWNLRWATIACLPQEEIEACIKKSMAQSKRISET